MSHKLLRASLGSLMLILLLSCGGGGGGGGGEAAGGSGSAPASGVFPEAGGGGADGAGVGGNAGDSASNDGTSTASGGDGGVGSGGTGVSTADAGTSVGGVDGMGSIIVGGVRYDVDRATVDLRDAPELKIGMSIAVTGPVDANFVNGTASRWSSAADVRGPVGKVDTAAGRFELLGSTVSVDEGTVWGDLSGMSGLVAGSSVQVWGLPTESGALRATRVESRSAGAAPIATGMLTQLDRGARTFMLGGLRVSYAAAGFGQGLSAEQLADGLVVRVRATSQPAPDGLAAEQVERWHALPTQAGVAVQLEGVISGFSSQGSFRVLGTPVDASAVQQVTGGQSDRLGNGVKVVASGTLNGSGVLVASKLKIRHLPGGGALPSYTLIGTVGNFGSPSQFRVRGQWVDASAPGIAENAGQLANGVSVTVQGTQVVNDVLVASRLRFN